LTEDFIIHLSLLVSFIILKEYLNKSRNKLTLPSIKWSHSWLCGCFNV